VAADGSVMADDGALLLVGALLYLQKSGEQGDLVFLGEDCRCNDQENRFLSKYDSTKRVKSL